MAKIASRSARTGSVAGRGSVSQTPKYNIPQPRASVSEGFKKVHEANQKALRTLYNR